MMMKQLIFKTCRSLASSDQEDQLGPLWLDRLLNSCSHGYSGVGTRSHTFLHEITFKCSYDLTHVLGERKFALLVKSLQ